MPNFDQPQVENKENREWSEARVREFALFLDKLPKGNQDLVRERAKEDLSKAPQSDIAMLALSEMVRNADYRGEYLGENVDLGAENLNPETVKFINKKIENRLMSAALRKVSEDLLRELREADTFVLEDKDSFESECPECKVKVQDKNAVVVKNSPAVKAGLRLRKDREYDRLPFYITPPKEQAGDVESVSLSTLGLHILKDHGADAYDQFVEESDKLEADKQQKMVGEQAREVARRVAKLADTTEDYEKFKQEELSKGRTEADIDQFGGEEYWRKNRQESLSEDIVKQERAEAEVRWRRPTVDQLADFVGFKG